MPIPANTFTRVSMGANGVGPVREDLIEKITMTNPDWTPVVSSAGTAVAKQTYHEFQRDSLRAANKDNAALDGDDAVGSAKTRPVRVANTCQIFQDTIITSGRSEKVATAGMKSPMAYYKAKAYKEIQRDLEAAVVSKNTAVEDNGTLAGKLAGLGRMVYTNAFHGGAGATPAHTSGIASTALTAGTNRTFAEPLLKTALQTTYTACGEVPGELYMSPNHKSIFSTFVGIAANRQEVGKNKQAAITSGADVYVSDFGALTIKPHYLMAGADYVLGLNTDYIDIAYLRGFTSKPLAKTGDSDREQVLVDATLRVTSEVAQFKIDNLTA
jgi:hypothetical protein